MQDAEYACHASHRAHLPAYWPQAPGLGLETNASTIFSFVPGCPLPELFLCHVYFAASKLRDGGCHRSCNEQRELLLKG